MFDLNSVLKCMKSGSDNVEEGIVQHFYVLVDLSPMEKGFRKSF